MTDCTCGATLKHSADCVIFWAPLPREMRLADIVHYTIPAACRWALPFNGAPQPRQMKLGDLYAYYNFGWHQFDWPVLPVEWYS